MPRMTKSRARIPLFEGYSGRVVPGKGPVPCDMVLIGEAPGRNEDERGEPFVGLAGQLLDEALLKAGLGRASVYVTNVVKRRPPSNRVPTPAELKWWVPSLHEELASVQPKVVVALGDSALKALTGKTGITRRRGVEINVEHGYKVLPTFHPAYALRSPRALPILIADLQRAALILKDGARATPTETIIIETKKLYAYFADSTVIAYDVETRGLDPRNPDNRLLGVGMTRHEGKALYFVVNDDTLPAIKEAFAYPAKFVAHNGLFDNRWLRRYNIEVRQTFDTMIASFLLDPTRRMALEYLLVELLGFEPYHEATQKMLDAGRGDEVPLEDLAARCGRDVDGTLRLYTYFKERILKDAGLARLMQHIALPISKIIEKIEDTGFPLDVELLAQTREYFYSKEAGLGAKMQQLAGLKELVNFNSTQVLAKIMFTQMGLPVVKLTPKGRPSTDKEVLMKLQDMSPFVRAVLERRKCTKLRTAYVERWAERQQNGRLYGQISLTRTRTMRLASDLMQVPRALTEDGKRIRDLITATPDHVILEADFAQIEPRIMAWLSGDQAMLQIFQEDRDIYAETARDVLRVEATKETRQKAKPVVLGFQYRMGWLKFMTYAFMEYGIRFTEDEAQEVQRRFFHKYSGLLSYYMRQEMEVRRTKQVRTPLGFIRPLADILSPDKDVREEAIRQAINTPVQATGNHFNLLAAIEARRELPASHRLLLPNHDSLIWEVPENDVESAARVVKQVMEVQVPQIVKDKFGIVLPVPLVAEVKFGRRWGSLAELHLTAA